MSTREILVSSLTRALTYWVIDNPEAICDFVNSEIRKEWEADARSEHRDLNDDPWLKTLTKRRWHLEIMDITQINLARASTFRLT